MAIIHVHILLQIVVYIAGTLCVRGSDGGRPGAESGTRGRTDFSQN
jgi:hypothetical protein